MARCDKSEHLYRIKAPLFIDCHGRFAPGAGSRRGDALGPRSAQRVQRVAGAGEGRQGDARHQHPVHLAPAQSADAVHAAEVGAQGHQGASANSARPTSWEYGYWWIEWGGNLDTIRDNERIRFELLAITMGVWDYIKNSGDHPDSANWALDWVGMMPGRRGSRRVVGDSPGDPARPHARRLRRRGGHRRLAHGRSPAGRIRPSGPAAQHGAQDRMRSTTFRCARSTAGTSPNLMMAGRNISATHAAFTSTRVMATCAAIGQAVGTAAAQCVRE